MEQGKKKKLESTKQEAKSKTMRPKVKAVALKKGGKESKSVPKEKLPNNPVTVARTVGQIFKEERLKKGISLNDVVKNLYIQRGYLEAIENSDHDRLPAVAYTIGFVRTYAHFLNLDSKYLVKEFQKEYVPLKDDRGRGSLNIQPVNQKPSQNILWMAAGGVVIILVLLYLVKSSHHNAGSYETQSVTSNAVAEAPAESTNTNLSQK